MQDYKNLGSTVNANDLVLHIVSNLPEEYENTVKIMYDDLVQNKLSLKSLRGKLSVKFKRLNRGTSREDSALKIWETKKVNDRPNNYNNAILILG